ncbi:hypothetical protein FACS189485_16900 [Spirochaetia bacterium]|nr:hypothetical protein FACS189485_16900 [Spirochaetia bacterium]
MDSNEISFEEFFYPFSWKRPLVYVILCVAIGLYIYLFFIHHDTEVFGVMERSKRSKLLAVFVTMTLVFFSFRLSHFVESIESLFLRGLLLLGTFFLITIFITFNEWRYNTYDTHELRTYVRVFPFKSSPYFDITKQFVYSNIKAITSSPGNDTGALYFKFNDGRQISLDVNSIPMKSKHMFYQTLYKECDWLRDDIVREVGSIEKIEKYAEGENEETMSDLFFLLFDIFASLVECICLILYTLKIKI